MHELMCKRALKNTCMYTIQHMVYIYRDNMLYFVGCYNYSEYTHNKCHSETLTLKQFFHYLKRGSLQIIFSLSLQILYTLPPMQSYHKSVSDMSYNDLTMPSPSCLRLCAVLSSCTKRSTALKNPCSI